MGFVEMVVAASKHVGRPPKYTPETLLAKFNEYVKFNADNPWKIGELLKDPKKFKAKEVHKTAIPPLTQGMFQVFAGINRSTWDNLTKKPQFFAVTEHILETIRGHKFAGASIRVYDSNIIARDLGLVDKQSIDNQFNIEWNEEKTYEGDRPKTSTETSVDKASSTKAGGKKRT